MLETYMGQIRTAAQTLGTDRTYGYTVPRQTARPRPSSNQQKQKNEEKTPRDPSFLGHDSPSECRLGPRA